MTIAVAPKAVRAMTTPFVEGTLAEGNLDLPASFAHTRMTLNIENGSCEDIVRQIFQKVESKFVFDEPLPRNVSVDIRNVSLNNEFEQLYAFRVDCQRDTEGVFHFFNLQKGRLIPGHPELNNKRFYMEVRKRTPVREILTRFFDEAKVPYYLSPHIATSATLRMGGIDFRRALRLLLLQYNSSQPLTYRVVEGRYIVYPRGEALPHIPATPE